jgi:hypothetical protein
MALIRFCTAEATPLDAPTRELGEPHEPPPTPRPRQSQACPPAGFDDYKVLRVLVAQMPMIHQVAALEQIDVQGHRRIAAMVIITR